MPLNREVKIIKVPLSDKERAPDYPKNFPRMPRLYLELLENKAKIKQDLINKEYVPPSIETKTQEDYKNIPDDRDKDRHDRDNNQDNNEDDRDNNQDNRDNHRDRERSDKRDRRDNDHGRSDSTSSSSSSRSVSVSSNEDKDKNYKEDTEIQEKRNSHSSTSRSSSGSRSDSDSDSDTTSSSSYSRKSRDSDALSDRLKDLLGDTESEKSRSVSKESYTDDKYSRPQKQKPPPASHFTPYDKYKQQKETAPPPTLAELEARGHYHHKAELRDINHVGASEYEDEDKKRELIFKFGLLKKSYPLAGPTIPEYTVHSDLREMQKSYDDTVRRLSLDSTVENYKTYLIGGFMVVEFVFGNFLGFDMQGFTQQQIVSMHSYEKLLIELGEKSYIPSGSKWPVELRLLFLIIMNAGFFIVSKMIMRKTGANLLNMVNSMNTPPQQTSARPKRRMKGPNINLDDIPDAEDIEQTANK